jgi:mannosyltransferase OCH1-like enzyme
MTNKLTNNMIPKLIHQTWKTEKIPQKWVPFADKVKLLNPGWTYKLWSDQENDEFVKKEFPEFYQVFTGFPRNIMKADTIRYFIMYKLGGVYLDLDYEVLKPFDFEKFNIILPLEEGINEDSIKYIGNCFLASVPGHKFWSDVINDLRMNPPMVTDHSQVIKATGPMLLTKIYNANNYNDIYTPEKIVYIPQLDKKKKDIEKIKNNGITLGIHHEWGTWRRSTWKERLTIAHVKLLLQTSIIMRPG